MSDERELLRRTAELAADFVESLDVRRVFPDAPVEELAAALGGPLPEQPSDPLQVPRAALRGGDRGASRLHRPQRRRHQPGALPLRGRRGDAIGARRRPAERRGVDGRDGVAGSPGDPRLRLELEDDGGGHRPHGGRLRGGAGNGLSRRSRNAPSAPAALYSAWHCKGADCVPIAPRPTRRPAFGATVEAWDEYLYEACSYVVLNPVRAGLCVLAEEWPWSFSAYGLAAT